MGGRNAAVLTILIMLVINANTVTYVTKTQAKPFSHMTHMDWGMQIMQEHLSALVLHGTCAPRVYIHPWIKKRGACAPLIRESIS